MSPSSPSVLVCDDARFVRGLIAGTLTDAGFRIAGEAATGREALDLYAALRPDLVTLDLVLPELGGLDVLREILSIDPSARVLVCSAMAQRNVIQEALENGARDFVAKPFHPARILEAAHRTLG